MELLNIHYKKSTYLYCYMYIYMYSVLQTINTRRSSNICDNTGRTLRPCIFSSFHFTHTSANLFDYRLDCFRSFLLSISRQNKISPLWFLIQNLDHNSALHAKNQREISSNKVRRLLCLQEGENAGGRKWYKERGKWIIESRIEFPDPMLIWL